MSHTIRPAPIRASSFNATCHIVLLALHAEIFILMEREK